MRRFPIPGRTWPRTLCLLTVLLPGAAQAEVQVKTLADGSKLIFNENETQRARRTARTLVSVPSPEIGVLIDRHARRQGLSPRLVQAVMQVESGYNPRALSSKGAMGLMQLMPDTARMLRVTDPWDPDQNIRGGTIYLRQMLQRFGNMTMALAAYNAGPTVVARYDGVPPYRETRNFVRRVLGLYHGNASTGLWQPTRAQADKPGEASGKPNKGGAKVYVTLDENNRFVFTTSPPKSN